MHLTLGLLPQPSNSAPDGHSTSSALYTNRQKELVSRWKTMTSQEQTTKKMDHYFNVYAPPAFTFPQSLQPQIPTAFLFTAYCDIYTKCKAESYQEEQTFAENDPFSKLHQ